jgi:hypothetical protein
MIEAGANFYLALSEKNILYGWGVVKNLGVGKLLDSHEKPV